MRHEMQADRKLNQGDAFDRAIREIFGETAATRVQVEAARKLYARYRTDDVLNRLRRAAPDKNGEPQPGE
jgi:hypothetical protein